MKGYLSIHCVKSVQLRSFSGPYFPVFGLNTETSKSPYSVRIQENTDQKNSVFRHFSRNGHLQMQLDI